MKPGVLLDRDGTIIVDYRYVGDLSRVQFIDGAPDAIAAFNRAGIPVALITNQSGVARGYYTIPDIYKLHEYLADQLAQRGAHIDHWSFSPHHPEAVLPEFREDSPDHKPHPGMAQKAAAALDLDLTKSWVVGDRAEDMNLAGEIGANGVFLGAEEDRHPAWGPFVYNYPSLAAAAPFIIEEITDVVLLDSFPSKRLPDPSHYIDAYREEQTLAFRSIDPQHFKAAALALQAAIRERHWVFTAGNGGSAAVANHLWCDHAKMIRHSTELRPRVMSLSASAEIMTAIANDIGFDSIFAYQLEGVAEPGDVLIVFSVSGQSLDVIRAVQWANEHGMKTIAVTAFGGGQARELADTSIHIKTDNYGIAEDIMQAVMHAFAQYIRQFEMTPEAIRYSRF